MNISIYTVVKDQKRLAEFYYEHYRNLFPGCKFFIFDNNSTDGTADVFSGDDCVVENYPAYDEVRKTYHYNNVWKGSDADWVIVCDIDELIQITPEQLKEEHEAGTNVIFFQGWQMIALDDTYNNDPRTITHGFRDSRYDKAAMFNPLIDEIGYTLGAHMAKPEPKEMKMVGWKYKLLHYNEAFFTTTTPKINKPEGFPDVDWKAAYEGWLSKSIKLL
jgi:hypothetical protein